MTLGARRLDPGELGRKLPGPLLAVALLALGALLALHRLDSHDLWWQLAAGDWVARRGIPRLDPFSYAEGVRPWIEVRWLYCWGTEVLFRIGGLNALVGLQVVLSLLTLGLIGFATRRPSPGALASGLAVTVLAAHLRFSLRPELLSFVFLAATLALLARYLESGDWRLLAPLPLLQVLWANGHTLFVLGPVTLAIATVSEALLGGLPAARRSGLALDRRLLPPLALATLAMTAACWLNPYGTAGALFPLRLLSEIRGSQAMTDLVTELQSPLRFAGATPVFWRFPLAVAGSALAFWLGRRKVRAAWVALWLAFLYLAVLADRNVALFGIVAGVTTLTALSSRASATPVPSRRGAILLWCGLAATGLAIFAVTTDRYWVRVDPARRFGFGVAAQRFPLPALTLLSQVAPAARLLTDWGDGSAALFLRGERSVLADGRLEVYGGEEIERIDRLFREGAGFDALRERYGIDAVLLAQGRSGGLLRLLLRRPDWEAIHYDPGHVLFLRSGAIPAAERSLGAIDWNAPRSPVVPLPPALDPPRWLATRRGAADGIEAKGLGELALLVGNLHWAREELASAERARPGDREVRLRLGVVERALGEDRRADALLGSLGDEGARVGDALAAAAAFEGAGSYEAELATLAGMVERGAEVPPGVSGALVQLAATTGRYAAAEAALSRWSARAPREVTVWNAWGALALRHGDREAACERFARSLALEPGQAGVRSALAACPTASGEASVRGPGSP